MMSSDMNEPLFTSRDLGAGVKLYLGDCLDVMRSMPDASIDSIVSDPPYGISFMSRKWDYDLPDVKTLKECLRVLKEGKYFVAFSSRRTCHRLIERVVEAGFILFQTCYWLYGEGAPKAGSISAIIDKKLAPGQKGEVVKMVNPYPDGRKRAERAWGGGIFGEYPARKLENGEQPVYASVTAEAKKWEGWYTNLKPAFEPIIIAVKPPVGYADDKVRAYYCGKARNKDRDSGITSDLREKDSEPVEKKEGSQGLKTSRKAVKRDDILNFHKTVKPTALMRKLLKDFVPENGVILDMYMGSGSTGKAAALEELEFIGIERESDYFELAVLRVTHALENLQRNLFD